VENFSVGTKIITYYKDNRSRYGLPTLYGIIVPNDLSDGRPLAIIDGAYITAARTGAAGAVAAKYLARKDSERVAVIGAGTQGRFQVVALNEVLGISAVGIYDHHPQNAVEYAKEMSDQFGFKVEQMESAMQAVQDADVIITATPSTSPIVLNEWIKEGVHINAIGADAPDKQELDSAIVARAKVVVDSMSQCAERSEIQTAVRLGLLKRDAVYAELSDIVLERKARRVNAQELTLFDSTGLAIQDITTGYAVYELAKRQGIGIRVSIE